MYESRTWRRSEGEDRAGVGVVEKFGRVGRMEDGQSGWQERWALIVEITIEI